MLLDGTTGEESKIVPGKPRLRWQVVGDGEQPTRSLGGGKLRRRHRGAAGFARRCIRCSRRARPWWSPANRSASTTASRR
jgi:hypothetical protein